MKGKLFKENELQSCPKCGDGNRRGFSCGIEGPYIPSYYFRRGKKYCDGGACMLAPLQEEHMHDSCMNCGYTWAEEMPDLTPKPIPPKKTIWEKIAGWFGGECL